MKTIALDELTYKKLEGIKDETEARSYREVIQMLLEQSKNVPRTMKGAFPRLKPITAERERELEGEDDN